MEVNNHLFVEVEFWWGHATQVCWLLVFKLYSLVTEQSDAYFIGMGLKQIDLLIGGELYPRQIQLLVDRDVVEVYAAQLLLIPEIPYLLQH